MGGWVGVMHDRMDDRENRDVRVQRPDGGGERSDHWGIKTITEHAQ